MTTGEKKFRKLLLAMSDAVAKTAVEKDVKCAAQAFAKQLRAEVKKAQ